MAKKKSKAVKEPEPLELNTDTVLSICTDYIEKHNLVEVMGLSNWKLRLKVENELKLDEDTPCVGLCQYDRAYGFATIMIAVDGHDSEEDVKDTLVHELCHIVLHEMDSSARDMISTVPKNLRDYVAEQMHVARERSVIQLQNTFRTIFK